jgi:pyruvate/2-oxoglutarate dehydrogenase complex dihydrolipoamide dehydrogenase (E3) component
LGCELAQAFCGFGSYVVIAQDDPMFLPGEERDAAQILSEALARDGVEVHLNTTVVAVRMEGTQKVVDMICARDKFSVPVNEILVGIGRAPNVESLNLEAASVLYDTKAGIDIDDFLRISNPRIYAAGDVCLEHKFTHAAEASARIAMTNALFKGRGRLSAMTIPWCCTYTDPESLISVFTCERRGRNPYRWRLSRYSCMTSTTR